MLPDMVKDLTLGEYPHAHNTVVAVITLLQAHRRGERLSCVAARVASRAAHEALAAKFTLEARLEHA